MEAMAVGVAYEYISWSRFYHLCGRLYGRISASGYRPDMIVAIARGGYAPARILADYFGIMDLHSIKIEHYHGPDKMPRALIRSPLATNIAGRRVLLVDDVSDSGDTFSVAFNHLQSRGAPASLRTAVLHLKSTSGVKPDYCAKRIVKWRWITYPWALIEDLTVLATRMRPPAKDPQDLWDRLGRETGIALPKSLFPQVAATVLARAETLR